MNFFKPLLIAVCLFFIGCSQKPIYDLKPYNEEAEYEQGRLVAVRVDSLYESALNFETHSGNHLVFFVYFLNKSNEPVIINPGDFYIKSYKSKTDFEFEKRCNIINAFDPEKEIDRAAIDLQNTEDSYDALTGLNCLFGAIGLVSAAASDDDEDSAAEAVETIFIWTDNQISIEAGKEDAYIEFEQKRAFWQNEVLRKTTLDMDEEIGGMVHFQVYDDTKFLRLFVNFGSTEYSYSFEQFQINK